MQLAGPTLRQAAALTLHWERGDIEAVVVMVSDIESQDEAEDLIMALLMLRSRSITEIQRVVQGG